MSIFLQFVKMTGSPTHQLVDVTSISQPGLLGKTPEDIVSKMFHTTLVIWPQYQMLAQMVSFRTSFKMLIFGLVAFKMRILPGDGVMERPGDTHIGLTINPTIWMVCNLMWPSTSKPLVSGMMNMSRRNIALSAITRVRI